MVEPFDISVDVNTITVKLSESLVGNPVVLKVAD